MTMTYMHENYRREESRKIALGILMLFLAMLLGITIYEYAVLITKVFY